MSDLAAGERLGADGLPDEPLRKERAVSWRGWHGGIAMLVVCLAPEALLVFGRPDALRFHVGPNFGFDLGGLLSAAPGVAAFTMLSRLVGYRRRDAVLMFLLPVVPNVYLAWVAGARAVQLRPGDPPHRWAGSREATGTAVLMQCLVGGAYLAWILTVEIMAWP